MNDSCFFQKQKEKKAYASSERDRMSFICNLFLVFIQHINVKSNDIIMNVIGAKNSIQNVCHSLKGYGT